MNKKLQKDLSGFLIEFPFPWGDFTKYDQEYIDSLCKAIAQYFYNLALEDVKTEIMAYTETQTGGFKELLSFIDKQSK